MNLAIKYLKASEYGMLQSGQLSFLGDWVVSEWKTNQELINYSHFMDNLKNAIMSNDSRIASNRNTCINIFNSLKKMGTQIMFEQVRSIPWCQFKTGAVSFLYQALQTGYLQVQMKNSGNRIEMYHNIEPTIWAAMNTPGKDFDEFKQYLKAENITQCFVGSFFGPELFDISDFGYIMDQTQMKYQDSPKFILMALTVAKQMNQINDKIKTCEDKSMINVDPFLPKKLDMSQVDLNLAEKVKKLVESDAKGTPLNDDDIWYAAKLIALNKDLAKEYINVRTSANVIPARVLRVDVNGKTIEEYMKQYKIKNCTYAYYIMAADIFRYNNSLLFDEMRKELSLFYWDYNNTTIKPMGIYWDSNTCKEASDIIGQLRLSGSKMFDQFDIYDPKLCMKKYFQLTEENHDADPDVVSFGIPIMKIKWALKELAIKNICGNLAEEAKSAIESINIADLYLAMWTIHNPSFRIDFDLVHNGIVVSHNCDMDICSMTKEQAIINKNRWLMNPNSIPISPTPSQIILPLSGKMFTETCKGCPMHSCLYRVITWIVCLQKAGKNLSNSDIENGGKKEHLFNFEWKPEGGLEELDLEDFNNAVMMTAENLVSLEPYTTNGAPTILSSDMGIWIASLNGKLREPCLNKRITCKNYNWGVYINKDLTLTRSLKELIEIDRFSGTIAAAAYIYYLLASDREKEIYNGREEIKDEIMYALNWNIFKEYFKDLPNTENDQGLIKNDKDIFNEFCYCVRRNKLPSDDLVEVNGTPFAYQIERYSGLINGCMYHTFYADAASIRKCGKTKYLVSETTNKIMNAMTKTNTTIEQIKEINNQIKKERNQHLNQHQIEKKNENITNRSKDFDPFTTPDVDSMSLFGNRMYHDQPVNNYSQNTSAMYGQNYQYQNLGVPQTNQHMDYQNSEYAPVQQNEPQPPQAMNQGGYFGMDQTERENHYQEVKTGQQIPQQNTAYDPITNAQNIFVQQSNVPQNLFKEQGFDQQNQREQTQSPFANQTSSPFVDDKQTYNMQIQQQSVQRETMTEEKRPTDDLASFLAGVPTVSGKQTPFVQAPTPQKEQPMIREKDAQAHNPQTYGYHQNGFNQTQPQYNPASTTPDIKTLLQQFKQMTIEKNITVVQGVRLNLQDKNSINQFMQRLYMIDQRQLNQNELMLLSNLVNTLNLYINN